MDLLLVSDRLFGRRLRLVTAAWVSSQADPFFQAQATNAIRHLAGVLSVTQNDVADELARLIIVGMVDPLPDKGDGRKWYQRRSSPLWDIVQTALHVVPTA